MYVENSIKKLKPQVLKTVTGKKNLYGIIKGEVSVIECIVCGKQKAIPHSVILKGHGKYCSRKCYFNNLRGSTVTKKNVVKRKNN